MRSGVVIAASTTFFGACSAPKDLGYPEGLTKLAVPFVSDELASFVDAERAMNCHSLLSVFLADGEVEMNVSMSRDVEFSHLVWSDVASEKGVTSSDVQRTSVFVEGAVSRAEPNQVGDLVVSCVDDVARASGVVQAKIESGELVL